MSPSTSIRRWFRFSLLGLLVMVTLAAAAAGWVAYHLDWIRQRPAEVEKAEVPLDGEDVVRMESDENPFGAR